MIDICPDEHRVSPPSQTRDSEKWVTFGTEQA